MPLGKSNDTLLLVEWKHVFISPSKQFDKFDKLVIQGSLKWMKEWNKVIEEYMKEIEECVFLYCKTAKMLVLRLCFTLKEKLKLKSYLFCLWHNLP